MLWLIVRSTLLWLCSFFATWTRRGRAARLFLSPSVKMLFTSFMATLLRGCWSRLLTTLCTGMDLDVTYRLAGLHTRSRTRSTTHLSGLFELLELVLALCVLLPVPSTFAEVLDTPIDDGCLVDCHRV